MRVHPVIATAAIQSAQDMTYHATSTLTTWGDHYQLYQPRISGLYRIPIWQELVRESDLAFGVAYLNDLARRQGGPR
jgi:hypothetical protein